MAETIRDDVLQWLLDENNPPVRYLTLTNLLGRPESDSDVRQAKARLMDYAVTEGILEHADEFWNPDEGSQWKSYWKYTGRYWQLIFLGQFLADGYDPRIRRGVEEILRESRWVRKTGMQCLTANLLAALMRLGYRDHPVVVEEIEALAQRIVADDGLCCEAMLYSLLTHCYMAQPKALLCFAEIPASERSEAVNSAVERLVYNLLENGVYVYVPSARKQWQKVLKQAPKKAELPKGQTVKGWILERKRAFLDVHGLGPRVPKQGWLKFGFPLHYNSDILEAMVALARLEVPMGSTLEKPLQIIEDKMTPEGTWILDNSLNGKMWVDVEEKGKPSKWITYFARFVLDHFKP